MRARASRVRTQNSTTMLKPKRKQVLSKVHKGYAPTTRHYKPLSFYLAGGPDLDGDALKQDASSKSDPDADEENWMQIFGTDFNGDSAVFADPFCDPRHDIFSIAELSGTSDFRAALREARARQSDAQTVQSSQPASAESASAFTTT